jgi:hypothetical protein
MIPKFTPDIPTTYIENVMESVLTDQQPEKNWYKIEGQNSVEEYRIIGQNEEWNKKQAPYLYDGTVRGANNEALFPRQGDLLVHLNLQVKGGEAQPIYLPYSYLEAYPNGIVEFRFKEQAIQLKVQDLEAWKKNMEYVMVDAFEVNKGAAQAPMSRAQGEQYLREIRGKNRQEQELFVQKGKSQAVPLQPPTKEIQEELAERATEKAKERFGADEATQYFKSELPGTKLTIKSTATGTSFEQFKELNREPLPYEQVGFDGYSQEEKNIILYIPVPGKLTDIHLSLTEQGILALQCHTAPIEFAGITLPSRNLHFVKDISEFTDIPKLQKALKDSPANALSFTFESGLQIKLHDAA